MQWLFRFPENITGLLSKAKRIVRWARKASGLNECYLECALFPTLSPNKKVADGYIVKIL
jgi:hypothetical protein